MKALLAFYLFNLALLGSSISVAADSAGIPAVPSDAACMFRIVDSAGMGAFNLPGSRASLSKRKESGSDVIQVDFELSAESAAGAWINEFPSWIVKGRADTLSLTCELFEDHDSREVVRVFLELKGSDGIQRVKLSSSGTAGFFREKILIDWEDIGTLKEIALALFPDTKMDSISGQVLFSAEIRKLSFLEKFSTTFFGRATACFLLAILLASFLAIFARSSVGAKSVASAQSFSTGALRPFFRDFLLGSALAILLPAILACHFIGVSSPFEAIWICLAVALSSFFVSLLAKLYFNGKILSPREAFVDIFCCGLLACGVSDAEIWEAPASFSGFFRLSAFSGAFFLLGYHLGNIYRLSSSKKHLSSLVSLCISLCPYFFGVLLAVQNASLLFPLRLLNITGYSVSDDLLAGFPLILGLLFFFNAVVLNVSSLLACGIFASDIRKYFCLFAFSFCAVFSPIVADLGSGALSLPADFSFLVSIVAAIFSQGWLWAEVFLMTGVVLEAARGKVPSSDEMFGMALDGFRKGAVFSGILMTILQMLGFCLESGPVCALFRHFYIFLAPAVVAAAFPLVKTIVETFDGSVSFFARAGRAFQSPTLYARGFVAGVSISVAIAFSISSASVSTRMLFGLLSGMVCYALVSFVRDIIYFLNGTGEPAGWRCYAIEAAFGGFVGAGLAFYFDTPQIHAIADKLMLYKSFGAAPASDSFYPLLSTWGKVELSPYCGGAKLLYNESLKGVIGWAVAAWLFAINKSLLVAVFERNFFHVRRLTSREGIAELVDGTVHVLRWGLWMAPIIFTFLKQMHEPTWYNQDGAIRTLFAIWNDMTLSPADFAKWSLTVFMWVLAYDFFRILIWLDHMGLRVATLVNLSFIGMDRLDAIFARATGSRTSSRFIPEGIKRFATWAPLLIPFYIPAGDQWSWAWSAAETIQNSKGTGLISWFLRLPPATAAAVFILSIATCSAVVCLVRMLKEKFRPVDIARFKISNRRYLVEMDENFSKRSSDRVSGFDLARRSYNFLDPSGTALFICEIRKDRRIEFFPLLGNIWTPREKFERSIDGDETHIHVIGNWNSSRVSATITLLPETQTAEKWEIKIENLSDSNREFRIVPYLEWNLNTPDGDRSHTQFNRLFPEISYRSKLDCVVAEHRMTRKSGFLASSEKTLGFLSSRMDFIGRAGTLANPLAIQEMCFHPDCDVEPAPSFEPAGALLVPLKLMPGETRSFDIVAGFADSPGAAFETVAKEFGKPLPPETRNGIFVRPGHGKTPDGVPKYCEFRDDGRVLAVFTPFTPRPFDHCLANSKGQATTVTNRGLHTSSNVNSQQNQLTANWADTVTSENPSETIYVYDISAAAWFSPTYLPMRDQNTDYFCEFSLFGTAKFHARGESLESELVVFVPVEDPVTVYGLRLINKSAVAKKIRISPFFRVVLADKPGDFVKIFFTEEKKHDILLFSNPNNRFRKGTAFAAMSEPVKAFETRGGRFFGRRASVSEPEMLQTGSSADFEQDKTPVAALLCEIEIPPGGEKTVNIILGQTDSKPQSIELAKKYKVPGNVSAELSKTEKFWASFIMSAKMTEAKSDASIYMNWLKYQTLAERIWARRGFYQSSGAFGFRDQLQDSVNLAFFKPEIAREQILINAAHQFVEGDAAHWFFLDEKGKTGFLSRSYASDNLLWLVWACVEYMSISGDVSILESRVSYLETETPMAKLPLGKHGMCFVPLRSPKKETLFRHIMRAVDLVLNTKLGKNGLPLMGTGDWNDGFDETGSAGKGESVWLAFFLFYCLKNLLPVIEKKLGEKSKERYSRKLESLRIAIEKTWRGDRYLRAIHDDGTEIGVGNSGVWELDAINAGWATISGVNPERAKIFFDTAVSTLEKEKVILLGWPPLNEKTKPYLGRSCRYPEGVRENGMYCHGVQWLVGASIILSEQLASKGLREESEKYRETAKRLWNKISSPWRYEDIENFGGQPNKQSADMLTKFAEGRMIWNGYTGAAGWMLRQGLHLDKNFNSTVMDTAITGAMKNTGALRTKCKSDIFNA